MNMRANTIALGLVLGLALGPVAPFAQETDDPFLSDYAGLKPSPDNPFDELYIAPGALSRAAKYTAVMVDQPEMFVHPSSKYKGIKPDDMKTIADALREAITTELQGGGYQIVDAPGANVMYVRFAVGDLMLEKKKRSILAYTPAGAVLHAAKGAIQGVTGKVNVKSMKIEGEVLDSQSLEQLAAMTTSRGSLTSKADDDPANEVSWDEMTALFEVVGKRLRCRLDNSKKAESQWTNCGAIGLVAE